MAIRVDDQRRVAPGQAPGTFDTPNNQGATIAARQMSMVGQQVVRAADAATDIYVRELEKTNQARVNEALAKAQSSAREYELQGRSYKGGNVYGGEFETTPLPEYFAGKIDEDFAEIEAGLSNDAQIAAFRERAVPLRETTRMSLSAYEQEQGQQYRVEAHTAFASEGKLSVERGWQSDAQIMNGLEDLEKGLRDLGGLRGTAPELVDQQVRAGRSGALLGALTAAAAEEDAVRLEQLWSTYETSLLPDDWLKADKLREPFVISRAVDQYTQYVFSPDAVPADFGTQPKAGELVYRAPVDRDVAAEASRRGVDPVVALTILNLENAGRDPLIKNPESSAHGLFQITDSTWARLGGGNRNDTGTQISRGVQNIALEAAQLEQALGRKPEGWEIYLAHQQGQGGARALLRNPQQNAIAALTPVYVREFGPSRGPQIARDAVLNNGGTAGMTAAQFASVWQGKYDRRRADGGTSAPPPDVERPPARPPTSAAEAYQFGYQYAILGGETQSVAQKVGEAASRNYEAQQAARKEAEDRAVQAAYDLALQRGITSIDQLPAEVRAAIPVDRRATVDGHLANLDPAKLRDTPDNIYLATRDDAFVAELLRPGNENALMDVLGQMSQADQREMLSRGARITGRSYGGAAAGADWQKMPEGWVGQLDRHAADLALDGPDKAMLGRVVERAIRVEQQNKGSTLTAEETQRLVARVVTTRLPSGELLAPGSTPEQRAAYTQRGARRPLAASAGLRDYGRAAVDTMRSQLRQSLGYEPSDADVEEALFLRAVYGGDLRPGVR